MEYDNEYMFFPVPNVTIHDLYDWSGGMAKDDSGTIVMCDMTSTHSHGSIRSPSRRVSIRTGRLVKVNEHEVALFRYAHTVYAISERCPHAGGPLHIGDIEDLPEYLCVRCPYHGWKFDLKTGKCVHPKSRGDLTAVIYPVKVCTETGSLAIGFTQFSPQYFNDCFD